MRLPVPNKTLVALGCFAFFALLPEWIPALRNGRILNWNSLESVADFKSKDTPSNESAGGAEVGPARSNPGSTAPPFKSPNRYLIAPGSELDHLYEALENAESGTGVARILHYGDSPTTADLITADVRSLLQRQFGDAGHGFTLLARPWAWYGHRGVEIRASGWQIGPASTAGARDGRFGVGGVSFRGSPGAYSTLILRDTSHTEVEVAYQLEPLGGVFAVAAADAVLGEVDTHLDPKPSPNASSGMVDSAAQLNIPGYARFQLPAGTSSISIRVTSGSPRLYGMDLRKSSAGVVYSSLGLNGAYVGVLAKMFNESHWKLQLRHYKPDLVVINYGTNESVYAAYVDGTYANEIREVIRRVRDALPETSILVMSPMDRGQRDARGEISTVPALLRLVTLQERVAIETHCAFFNTFQAMGGAGTMARWYESEPRLVSADFIHPMPNGAKIVGSLLYRALSDGYRGYKIRRMHERLAELN